MATLKTFLKSEDAQLTASLLRSESIDATVFDESGYGGNILGATSNAIRIEVPEEQLEQARELLIASAEAIGVDEDTPVVSPAAQQLTPESKTQSAFRSLVVLEVVLMALAMVLDPYLYQDIPDPLPLWLTAPSGWEQFALFVAETWWTSLMLLILASVLLFFYIRVGRFLYIGTIIWGLVTCFAYPPDPMTAGGAIFSAARWMVTGAIMCMMFVPEVSRRFRSHVGDR